MTTIEFFEVTGPRWDLALCQKVEAAYADGQRVYLWAESEAEARRFDDLLWSFREDSFVPHGLWQGEAACDEPVAVGWRAGNPNRATCLALARDAAPADLAAFARVLDLAPVDLPGPLSAARRRFRSCRDAGLEVVFHKAG